MESQLPLYLYFLILIASIGGLVWGAERFVSGAAAIANNLGLSPLIIGLTVVSFGTSAPEILVSATAATKGAVSLAVGNALGSNLANIGLVLGLTSLVIPLAISARLSRTEIPMMVAITIFAGMVLYDGYLGRYECIALALCLVFFLIFLCLTASQHSLDPDIEITKMKWAMASFLTISGLILLVVSSNILVYSATGIAQAFGVSELVIGLTVVAVGTSLPELAASIAGAVKGHADLAIGNVIGSNIFNLAAVLPVAGIIYPSNIDNAHFWQDFGSLAGLSIFLGLFCLYQTKTGADGRFGRLPGALILGFYIGYYFILFK